MQARLDLLQALGAIDLSILQGNAQHEYTDYFNMTAPLPLSH